MGIMSVSKIDRTTVWRSMVKQIALLTVCFTQHDGKHMDQRSLTGKDNEGAFQRKSADSDCHLAAESVKMAVTCTSSTMSLKWLQRTFCKMLLTQHCPLLVLKCLCKLYWECLMIFFSSKHGRNWSKDNNDSRFSVNNDTSIQQVHYQVK